MKLLASLGVVTTNACSCKGRAKQMDQWGVQGCRSNRDEIVKWLQEEQDKRGWAATLSAAVMIAVNGLPLNPLDPMGSLVDEAIRRAEAHLSLS